MHPNIANRFILAIAALSICLVLPAIASYPWQAGDGSWRDRLNASTYTQIGNETLYNASDDLCVESYNIPGYSEWIDIETAAYRKGALDDDTIDWEAI
jgi:hypothetical protein